MPIVQFRHETKNVNISKRMFAPKKVTKMEAWLKDSRKLIKEIPQSDDVEWTLASSDASLKYVRFDFVHKLGDKCYVVIDRQAASLGS